VHEVAMESKDPMDPQAMMELQDPPDHKDLRVKLDLSVTQAFPDPQDQMEEMA
jgi:hypothetical protein